ncbi:helix-turn-helix domain-containing protein [Mesonia aestuariivivens]|uniref:Helix-turn-helix domain-containing protein n=1 Tax=Mesonia aestuariivivens TaxID=2796128 RepID=A0ABS6W1Y9_9FLAO|nr:helix-turn-helix domain-containing protein [Mesonia aestuariivivens]MBW2961837.1 helix-turn-helix domain-containing protein [Mesonia aestuariivivens]
MSYLIKPQDDFIYDIEFDMDLNPYGIRLSSLKYENTTHLTHRVYRASFYRMIWVSSGTVSLDLDLEAVTLSKDDFLFIGKNQVFQLKEFDKFNAYLIDFTENFYARNQLDIDLLQRSSLFYNDSGIVKLHLEEPYKEILKGFLSFFKGINYKEYDQLLYQFAHNTVERMLLFAELNLKLENNLTVPLVYTNSKEHSLIKQFQNLVANYYIAEKGVSFYAKQLNVSSRSLAAACTVANKPSPKRIIIDRILVEAKRLLKFTDLSVKEITYRLGYDQYNSFIKLFTSNVGLTPMNFREKFH